MTLGELAAEVDINECLARLEQKECWFNVKQPEGHYDLDLRDRL